jgi:phenylacetaldehyde dehydrogenase
MSTPQKELISNQQVRAFLDEPRKMLINGEWVDSASGKTFQIFNPATGSVLADY